MVFKSDPVPEMPYKPKEVMVRLTEPVKVGDAQFAVKINPFHKEAIDQAAQRLGLKQSDFVRRALYGVAMAVHRAAGVKDEE